MFNDPLIESIGRKIREGRRISSDEGIALFQSLDLIGIGKIANSIKEKKTGNRVTFVLNRQINPTNICVNGCTFCDFGVKKHDRNGYEMTLEEILAQCSPSMKEVHIVGGLNPSFSFVRALETVREIHRNFPSVQIKGFTAVEIDFFSKMEDSSPKEILSKLKEAGLAALTGGGAEIFSERVRKILCPKKIDGSQWLEIHRTAHHLGTPSNATMLYGHIETVPPLRYS